MKRAFTLLELIIVIIVLGILATLGFTQYTRVVERGRTAEAKAILGQMRMAQQAYYLEYGNYAGATQIDYLSVQVPTSCTSTHYFKYSLPDGNSASAIRCGTADGGKTPGSVTGYTITLTYASGVFSGTAGYY